MNGHAHFWYRASSAIARPIILGGGRSLITYLVTAELGLTTDEVPLSQVGQLSCTTSYLQCHMQLYSCGLEEAGLKCRMPHAMKSMWSTDFTLVFHSILYAGTTEVD